MVVKFGESQRKPASIAAQQRFQRTIGLCRRNRTAGVNHGAQSARLPHDRLAYSGADWDTVFPLDGHDQLRE
jgi:hypothetical protein